MLVFARTKRGTDRIAESLNRKGFSAAMIHGDRSQSQRTAALTGFQQGRFAFWWRRMWLRAAST